MLVMGLMHPNPPWLLVLHLELLFPLSCQFELLLAMQLENLYRGKVMVFELPIGSRGSPTQGKGTPEVHPDS